MRTCQSCALSFFVVEIMLVNFGFLTQSICGPLFQFFFLISSFAYAGFCFSFLSLALFLSLFFFFFLWWLLDELSGDSFYPPIIYKSLQRVSHQHHQV